MKPREPASVGAGARRSTAYCPTKRMMNYRKQHRLVTLIWPDNPVEKTRAQHLDEDMSALEALPPEDERSQLQEWLDLYTVLGGIRYAPQPLELLLLGREALPIPLEGELEKAATRLAERWEPNWKLYPRELEAAKLVAEREDDQSVRQVKVGALRVALFQALGDAAKPQLTKVGRERATALGSHIGLRLKQDLQQIASGEVTEDLLQKLRRAPAGLDPINSFRLVGDIEAALLGYDRRFEDLVPADLRPSLFSKWAFRQTVVRAERWVRDAAWPDPDLPDDVQLVHLTGGEDLILASERVRGSEILRVFDEPDASAERRATAQRRLVAVLDAATKGQRGTCQRR